jgi:hypothetical protein
MTRERRNAFASQCRAAAWDLILIAGFLLILAAGIWAVHTLEAMYP